jgi:hypothetical protein
MIARFEGDIQYGPASLHPGIVNGIDFGMGFPETLMVPFPHNDPVVHDKGTNHRVGRSPAPASGGQLQCHFHKMSVFHLA